MTRACRSPASGSVARTRIRLARPLGFKLWVCTARSVRLTKTAPCLTAWLCNFQSLVTETDRHYARSAASTSVGPVVNVKYHVECRPSTRGADVTSGQRQADPRISYGQ